jgi:hypothetical protein
METISKTERTTVTILGKIAGVDININYERKTGEPAQNINANCNLPSAVEGQQPTYINVSRQSNGQSSVTMNGNKDITEVATLIESIKAELEIIATEGVVI